MREAFFVSMLLVGACTNDGCPDVALSPDKIQACRFSFSNDDESNVVICGKADAVPPDTRVEVFAAGGTTSAYAADDGSFTLVAPADQGNTVLLAVVVECWEYTQYLELSFTVDDCTEDPSASE